MTTSATRTPLAGWASVPRDQGPDGDEFEHFVLRHWHPEWGDRRQALV